MSDTYAPLIPKRRYEMDGYRRNHEGEEEDDDEGLRTDYGSAVYHYPPHLQHGHFTSLEKLMFFLSSILLILLFIFVGLYARSSQADDEPTVPVPIPTTPANDTSNQCHSTNCIITAAQILQDVDPGLDPCDDFYAYTCNKWQNDHSIPDFNSRIDIQSIAQQSIYRRLDQILTHDFDKFQKRRPEDAWKLPNQETVLDRQLFTKLSDFYASCMNQDAIENAGVEPLFHLFRVIQRLIPLGQPVSPSHLQEAIEYLADRHIITLFDFRVVDTKENQPTLLLSPPLSSFAYSNTTLYLQTMISTLDHIFGKDTQNEFGFKYWSTTATARRIFEFEQKLTMAHGGGQAQWTLDELGIQIPQIDWRAYIQNHIGNDPFPKNRDTILVSDSAFIHYLSHDILSTDNNARTLQMYFLWKTLWMYIDVLGDEFIVPKRQLESIMEGIKDPRAKPERRDVCLQAIDHSAMGPLMGRYYVNDREQVIQASREKLNSVLIDQLAFKETQFDVMASDESIVTLSEYFGDIEIQKEDFFGNMLRNRLHSTRAMWKSLVKPSSVLWKNPQSVEIQHHLDKVVIPAGLLQLPFYDANGPLYLSVAALGQMIGREIVMHGLDAKGRDDTRDDHRNCLIAQYNAHGVDGVASLDNNVADQFLWLESMKDNKEHMMTLPGLKQQQWTNDQLAYIQFSRLFCSKTTEQRQALRNDVAPDHLRVNIPLINSNHFSKVFHCRKGSFMNPPNHKKCNIQKK